MIEIAERFRSPDAVKAAVLDPKNCNPDPLYDRLPAMWDDLSLTAGFPGILLLMAELQPVDPNGGWDATAHLYVLKIRDAIETQGRISCAMHGGLAGVCFALLQASHNRTRYQRLLEKLEDHLIASVETSYFLPLHHNLDHALPSSPFIYDLISGITGIGLYGLICLEQERFVRFSEEIVRLLIRLAQGLKVGERSVPGWYLPSEMQFLEEDRRQYPQGNFNLGLAHGIPGVLGFLALALEKGICLDGQKEAIESISHWLQKKQKKLCWPGKISWEEEISGELKSYSSRDAWCYGTPGVASALYFAGKVLKNKAWIDQALFAMRSVYDRSPEEWGLFSPTFCHGLSGLLLMSHLMAKREGDAKLQSHVKELQARVWDFYRPETPFGFPDFERTKKGGYASLNKAGVLEGGAGVLLTLLAVERNSSHWYYPFLI